MAARNKHPDFATLHPGYESEYASSRMFLSRDPVVSSPEMSLYESQRNPGIHAWWYRIHILFHHPNPDPKPV
jgi:hypothetical protein